MNSGVVAAVVGDSREAPQPGPPSSPKAVPRLRTLAFDLIVTVALVGLSLVLAGVAGLPGGVSPVWFGGGLLAALFIKTPPRRWVPAGILATVAWLVYWLEVGWSPSGSVVRACGELLTTVAVALAVRRWRCLAFSGVVDLVALTGIALVAAGMRVLWVGLALTVDERFGYHFADIAGNVALNTVLGVLVVVPFAASLAVPPTWQRPSRTQWQRGLALFSAPLLFAALGGLYPADVRWSGGEFLLFPLMIAAALLLPLRALAAWLMVISLVGAWAVIGGRGPYYRVDDSVLGLQVATFQAQALLIVLAMTAWALYVLRDSWTRADRQLEVTSTRLRAAFDSASVPISFGPLDGEGPLIANPAMAEFFELPRQRMPSLDWRTVTHPDDVDEDLRLTAALTRGEIDSFRMLKRYVLESGAMKWAAINVVRFEEPAASAPWSVVQIVDMTSEMSARADLQLSRERFSTVIHKAAIPMSFGPLQNGLAEVNDARCAFHQRSREELALMDWRELIHPDDLEAMIPLHDAIVSGEIDRYHVLQRFLMPDASTKWGDVMVARVDLALEEDDFVVVQIVDVTAEVEARGRLQRLVDTDSVTGLGSRSWITRQLETSLGQARRDGCPVTVLFVDLTAHEVASRPLGFETGDHIMSTIARSIADSVPPGFVVGRFTDSRLLVVAEGSDGGDVEAAARTIVDVASTEIMVGGQRFARTASIGVAVAGPKSTVSTLLRSADEALAVARETGRSRWHVVRDDDPGGPAADSLQREHNLRVALDRSQFLLHYQRQVRLADRTVTGHEALVRWLHPSRGVLPPSEFMAVMESSGLIVELGRQVLAMACADIARSSVLRGPVSVNVSALELTEPDWFSYVLDTLRSFNVPAHRLTIELTETTLLQLTPDARDALASIRELGMGLHIDDFGMGYASIGSLMKVPLTGLKLDRVFVEALSDPTSAGHDLVASIASMAKGLRLEPIAEGIETPEQARLVEGAGWTHGQGYLFGRPGPLGQS